MEELLWLCIISLSMIMCTIETDNADNQFCYKENGQTTCGGKDILHLTRIDGVQIGKEQTIESNGQQFQLKTISTHPLIIEIPNFLTDEESKHFINVAKKQGLQDSSTGVQNGGDTLMKLLDLNFDEMLSLQELRLTIESSFDVYPDDADILQMYEDTDLDKDKDGNISKEEMTGLSPRDMKRYIEEFLKIQPEKHSRLSQQVWMFPDKSVDQTFADIQKRVSDVVNLPLDIIRLSNFQVVKYGPKGHYNAHYDSDRIDHKVPCCKRFDTRSCRVCRYMTILFYLNDVEEGGDTAFVLAGDNTLSPDDARYSNKVNLYRKCSEARLHVKPETGKAIVWYNHYINDTTNWLGEMDNRTLHGGCPVVKGEKWIGNFWVRVTESAEEDFKRISEMNLKQKYQKTEL